MSHDAFRRLPRKLGWKYEYYGGKAHIRPGPTIVVARVAAASGGPPGEPPVDGGGSRTPTMRDFAGLTRLFVRAFEDTVEYCDVPRDRVRSSAGSCVRGFFEGRRGNPLDASRIVETAPGDFAGAALVVQKTHGPLLDLLMVDPRSQRRGMATWVVSAILRALRESGEPTLWSCYRLANEGSASWHRRFGFADEPDLNLALIKRDHAQQELAGRGASIDAAERRRLQEELATWTAEVERLERRARKEGQESVSPGMRIRAL